MTSTQPESECVPEEIGQARTSWPAGTVITWSYEKVCCGGSAGGTDSRAFGHAAGNLADLRSWRSGWRRWSPAAREGGAFQSCLLQTQEKLRDAGTGCQRRAEGNAPEPTG